jgi:hypothetical protein
MTPVSLGTASLIASYQAFSTTSSVSVLAPTLLSVTNLPASVGLGSANITVPLFADFSNGSNNVNVTAFNGVTRASSDTNVATITGAGVITLRAPGTSTITSAYASLTNQALLTVLAPSSLYVTNLPATLDAGSANLTVNLFADFANGTSNVNVTAATGVVRTSSDTNVATITGAGVITIRNPGVTTITSAFGGVTNQGTLTVVQPAGFVAGSLIHRYSFNEAMDTATVEDLVGTADGQLVNQVPGFAPGNFNGTGRYVFTGGPADATALTNSYINLPNRLISTLTSVTIEGWYTWNGGQWGRLFDFGMSNGALDESGGLEDVVGGSGVAYLFYTPHGTANQTPRWAISRNNTNYPAIANQETTTFSSGLGAIAPNSSNLVHFAIVYDAPRGVSRLYINGQRAGTGGATQTLSQVDDRNVWLGRSQYSGDGFFNGSLDEFRIYNGPLLDTDVAASFAAGPNALPVAKPTLSFSRGTGNQLIISWPVAAGTFTLKTSPVLGAGAVWSGAGAPTVVGGNNQVTVQTTADAAFYRLEQ